MSEQRVKVCDWKEEVTNVPQPHVKTCRTLADNVCSMCAGDFCNAHLNDQHLRASLELINMPIAPTDANPNPREESYGLEIRSITVCVTCFQIIRTGSEKRYEEPQDVPSTTFRRTLSALFNTTQAEIAEAIKVYWAHKALTKKRVD